MEIGHKMSKRSRYSVGSSHSEEKLKINVESEDRRSSSNPSYPRYSQDGDSPSYSRHQKDGDSPSYQRHQMEGDNPSYQRHQNEGDNPSYQRYTKVGDNLSYQRSSKDGGNRGPGLLGVAPPGYPTHGGRSSLATFEPISSSSRFVPVQSFKNNNLSWGVASESMECQDIHEAPFKSQMKEDEAPWKSQMRELKAYIVKLEDDKCELSSRVTEIQLQVNKDAEMISSAKKTIAEVKRAQECERKSIDNMKSALDKKKLAIEREKEAIYLERKLLKLDQQEKEKLNFQIVNLKKDLEDLKKEKTEEAEAMRSEEKRHVACEVEELELRRDLTRKAIEKELDIEKLEEKLEELTEQNCKLQMQINKKDSQNDKEISNLKAELELQRLRHESEREALKRKYDSEYEIFSRVKDSFDENMKINCVFCPPGNVQTISNYLFHIAREHMFDQYKAVDVKEGSAKVGMLLKILEDKAKKESLNEISRLNKYIDSLENNGKNVLVQKKEDFHGSIVNQQELTKDLESLLEVESNQKQQIEELRNKNAILEIEIKKLNSSEKCELDDEMSKKGIADAESEVLKRRIAIANLKISEYLQSINSLNDKIDNLQKGKLQIEMENIKLKEELSKINGDKSRLDSKLRTLEDEKDELAEAKICLESEISELIAQNKRKKRFKTENKYLRTDLASYEAENLQVKREIAKLREAVNLKENRINILQKDNIHLRQELEEATGRNSVLQSRLDGAIERVELFERETAECLKKQKDSDKFLDLGVESFLQAPLEDINITKIDDIDSDELEKLEDE